MGGKRGNLGKFGWKRGNLGKFWGEKGEFGPILRGKSRIWVNLGAKRGKLGGKREDLGNGAKNGGFGPSGNGAVLSIEGGENGAKKGRKWEMG